ncbi:MAG: sigma-70 family polymerase sigma factor [Geminicoccaceae bacterium]|nr:sigma-70 family polymerase sigma factor [Solirubrobacterales bacterium]MCE3247543.1 sigma-70 family polymerase sigma factor [Geminicoccaceae bacterium]
MTLRAGAKPLPPFERVIDLHGPTVLRFCAARVGSERAEDCFQETMLSALRAYEGVRDADAIRSWLFSIAARKAIDIHRAHASVPKPVEDLEPLADAHAAPALEDEIWARVRALPEKQRQAVTLRYRADLSHREIAEVMQTSEPAARRNVFEGLRRLRSKADAD